MENSKEVKVESVKAINLKTTTVTFNKEVDSATLASSVKVYLNGSSSAKNVGTGGSDVAYTLSKDGKTLTITHNTVLAQSTNLKLVIDGVKTKSGEKVAKYENTFTVTDTTFPTLDSVEVLNSKTVVVTTSEPLQDLSPVGYASRTEVKVDGVSVPVKVTTNVATNKVTLEFGSKLTVGTHKLQLADFTDFANFKVTAKEFDITVVADTTAPAVTAAESVDKNTAKITFSKPVDTLGTFTVNGKAADSISWTDNNTVLTFKTNADLFDLGSTVESTIKYKGTKDVEGNTVTEEKTFTFKATDDTEKPTIKAVEVKASNGVEVTFSESLSATGTVTVKNDKGTVIVNKLAVPALNNKNVATFTATQLGLSDNGGTYTLEFEGAKDNSVRKNEAEKYTTTITAKDIKKPTATGVYTEAGKVTIAFDEAMNTADLANKSNYLVTVSGEDKYLSDIENSKVTVAADGKSVVLEFTGASAASVIKVQAVKDLAGNILSNFNQKVNITNQSANTFTHSDVASVEAISNNKVKVTLGGNKTFSTADPSSFIFQDAIVATTTLRVATAAEISTDKKSVTLTLNDVIDATAKVDTKSLKLATAASNKLTKDQYGKELVIGTGDAVAVVDKIAPEIKEVKKAATNSFNITFSEAMDATATNVIDALKAGLVIIPEGSTTGTPIDATALTVTTADNATYNVAITDTALAVTAAGVKTLNFTIPNPVANLKDANNNRLAPVTAAKTVTIDVNTAAAIAQAAAVAKVSAAANDNTKAQALTLTDINTALGNTDAISANLAAYKTAIEAVATSAGLDTPAKIQALVDSVNAQALVDTEASKITKVAIETSPLVTNDNVVTKAQALVTQGYVVTLKSTANSAIDSDGKVTQEANSGSDVTGDVVFTVTKDGKSKEVTVSLEVKKETL